MKRALFRTLTNNFTCNPEADGERTMANLGLLTPFQSIITETVDFKDTLCIHVARPDKSLIQKEKKKKKDVH